MAAFAAGPFHSWAVHLGCAVRGHFGGGAREKCLVRSPCLGTAKRGTTVRDRYLANVLLLRTIGTQSREDSVTVFGSHDPAVPSQRRRAVKVRTGLMAALVLGMLIGAFLAGSHAPLAFGQADEKGAAPPEAATHPRYSVVATEGHNLIVTDNSNHTLYFYTIEREKPI